jgi:hypothetical protein
VRRLGEFVPLVIEPGGEGTLTIRVEEPPKAEKDYRDGYEESGPPNGNAGGYWDEADYAEAEADARVTDQIEKEAFDGHD